MLTSSCQIHDLAGDGRRRRLRVLRLRLGPTLGRLLVHVLQPCAGARRRKARQAWHRVRCLCHHRQQQPPAVLLHVRSPVCVCDRQEQWPEMRAKMGQALAPGCSLACAGASSARGARRARPPRALATPAQRGLALPRYSRGRSPHNPGFQTVILPGSPGMRCIHPHKISWDEA